MPVKRSNIRIVEVVTGLLLILSVLSFLVAFLLMFDYSIPNATLEEDLDFLADSILRQRISAFSWLATGVITLLLLPAYLILFHRFQKGMHIFNGFLLLTMSFSFFLMGINELEIASMVGIPMEAGELSTISDDMLFLTAIRQVMYLTKVGTTGFGAFATVFAISKFPDVKFPVFGSALAFLAGPIVVTFTWMNPDHILMTLALAITWAGLLIIGTKLTISGLYRNHPGQNKEAV